MNTNTMTSPASLRSWPLSARILRALSRDPSASDFAGGTVKTNESNALDYILKMVPDFLTLVRNRRVLDHACGWGWQAWAAAGKSASEVVGYDTDEGWIAKARAERSRPNLLFTTSLAEVEAKAPFDVVYSCSAFEHYADPAKELARMRDLTAPGGLIIVMFAEPWFSPHGSHMNGFTRLPYVNLLFPERSVLRVRSLYRQDGATRYEQVKGGLNRMTLSKFERIVAKSGLEVRSRRYYSVKRLPLVSTVPVVRELLTASAAVVLRRP